MSARRSSSPGDQKLEPYHILQPHFIPGYAGFCPGMRDVIGRSVGHCSRDLFADQPLMQTVCRLKQTSSRGDFKANGIVEGNFKQDTKVIEERQPTKKIFQSRMVPGYTGHIPHESRYYGASFARCYLQAFAEFERDQRVLRNGGSKPPNSSRHPDLSASAV